MPLVGQQLVGNRIGVLWPEHAAYMLGYVCQYAPKVSVLQALQITRCGPHGLSNPDCHLLAACAQLSLMSACWHESSQSAAFLSRLL